MISRRAIFAVAIAVLFWTVPSHARRATFVWDGGGGTANWSTAANWAGDVAPSTAGADAIEFPSGALQTTNTNDFVGATFQGITFSGATGTYTLNGNALTLTGGFIVQPPTGQYTINFPMNLAGVANVGFTGNAVLTLNGSISGAGSLSVAGFGFLQLGGVNTLAGFTSATGGTIWSLAGSVHGPVTVSGVGPHLIGDGTVGAANIGPAGNISPGPANELTGVLRTGNLAIPTNGAYGADINGAAVGTGYDQINVTGSVTLGGLLVCRMHGNTLPPGSQVTILANDGGDPIAGTFSNAPQGATICAQPMTISYIGGDGNDVVLTVAAIVPVLQPLVWLLLAAALAGLAAVRLRGRAVA